jgi:cytosine/adenosine deaminase-related metal-dependent hydrolase
VNAHTHLEFSDLVQPAGEPGMMLPDWIRLVIGRRKRGDRNVATVISAGLQENLEAGVTMIGEIATAGAASYASPNVGPAIVRFQEAIGFSAGRIDSVYVELQRRLDEAPAPKGLSPHAPYTVHPKLLERIVQLAANRDVPVAMHLAESREEIELLEAGEGPFRELLEERSMWDGEAIPCGSRPLDYLRLLDAAPRSLVIHGNYLSTEEIEFVAARRERMSVVYCPRTHAYFGHAPYPLPTMLRAGVCVAIASDSRASNPDLDLLKELQFVAGQTPAISAAQLVRMATLAAAAALGQADEVGSITVGKRADLVALACPTTTVDPYESVVHAIDGPRHVWLGGRSITKTRLSPS